MRRIILTGVLGWRCGDLAPHDPHRYAGGGVFGNCICTGRGNIVLVRVRGLSPHDPMGLNGRATRTYEVAP